MSAQRAKSPIFEELEWPEVKNGSGSQIQFCEIMSASSEEFQAQDPTNCVFVSENLGPEQLVRMMAEHSLQSLVQKRTSHFAFDLKSSGEILAQPELYFADGGKRLAENVLAEIEVQFCSPADKKNISEKVEGFVGEFANQNVKDSSTAILEELYMNAMFDAPKEATLRGQTNCSYSNGAVSTLRLFRGESRLIMTCEDPFGSLDLKKFLKRMDEVYKKGAGEAINLRGEGGAGIGCVIMFDHCEALFLGVVPGHRTLVSCVIPLGMSHRQRAQLKKSLHLVTGLIKK